MKPRFIRSFQNKLASLLAAAMLATAVVPAAAGAAEPEEITLPQSTVTEAANEAEGAPALEQQELNPTAAAPLSWNMLTKLHRSPLSISSILNPETKLTADERYMAFSHYDWDTGVRNGISLYDRLTGRTEELPMPDDKGTVIHFDMTPDARYFAFTYGEEYLNGKVRVYLYDRAATGNPLTVINDKTGPDVDMFTEGDYVSISDDGRFVVFDTEAKGIVPEDQDDNWDVYLYDRDGGSSKLQRLSVPYKVLPQRYNSMQASISGDGSKITFVSKAQLTEATDYIGTNSVYLYDRNAADGQKLKRLAQGKQPSISADGGFLAFSTNRFDLGPLDENQRDDIYVYNTTTNTYTLVSKNTNGTQHNGKSSNPAISRNGAYVAYELEVQRTGTESEKIIHVADRAGLMSSKVTVENGVKPLVSPSNKPYVSDSGKTVSFYSYYNEVIVGNTFKLFDHFIASQGTAPVWAAGSTLQATGIGDDRVTLTWPDVTDSEGIEGYQLHANGEFVAYIPASAANTYTVTGLNRQENQYVLQVDAVDSQYAQSYNGPAYVLEMLDDGENPPPDGEFPLFITWQTNDRNYDSGTLTQGAKIRINAGGAPKSAAKAEWTYKEWEGDQEVTKTASLALTENAAVPGFYSGTFELTPNTTELTSMKLIMKVGTQIVEEETDLDPIEVGGNLEVNFTGAEISEIQGAILNVSSLGAHEQIFFVEENGIGTITGLKPGDNYELTLRTADYMYDIGEVTGVQVLSGKTSSATIPVTVPARVRVRVLNEQGQPLPYVPVTLSDSKQKLLGTFDTREDGQTDWKEGLIRDEVVTASLDLSDFYDKLPENANLSMTLSGGDNVLTVNLISPDRGEVEVTVKNPSNHPVFNAYVTATQIYKGKPVVTQGRTSLDGKVRFELFAGIDVVLEGAEYSYDYSSEKITVAVPVGATKPKEVDLPVKQPATNVINLRVFKKALDTEWDGPLNMENESFHTLVRTKHGWISTYFSNAVRLGGSPGSEVQVCVSGVIYAYVNSCQTVTMDENSNATAEVRLEETGARVQGHVPVSRNIWYSAELYEIRNGIKHSIGNVWDNNFQSVPFNVNVPRGGTYQMNITKTNRDASYHYTYEYASVEFTVAENQVKNIGNVTFSASRYFTNKSGNRFTAQPAKAVPGSTVAMRASYRNGNDEAAAEAVLLLDIPEGLELESTEGVTGAKEPATVVGEGRILRVPLGNLAKDAIGTVSYKLKVSEAFNKDSLSAAARIQARIGGKTVEETIGTVILDTQRVTLDAPEIVSDAGKLAVVSGYAPVGSTVSIYDSNVRIGAAVANKSGLWKTQVTLTDLGSPSMHALWAETTIQSVVLKSAKAYVQYDHTGPQLTKMAFSQAPAGRWVSVETGKETPNFSYTVVPGNPFLFDFEFSNPDRVENVRVYLEGQEGDPILAVREGNLFRATVPTKYDALGGIYLDYDVVKIPGTYDGALPNLDDIRAQMPPKMRDFEVVTKNPLARGADGKYSGDAVLKFPQLNDMTMSFTMTVDPNSAYKPTEEEQELAERSGVPAILKSYDTEETDTSLSVKTRGYIPADLLAQELQGVKSNGRVSALAKEGDWGHTAEYFMEIKSDVDGVKEQISGVKDQYEGYMKYAQKINKIMYNVETSGMDCLEEMPNTAKQAGKALAYTIMGEIAKTGMGAATAAMSLTGPAGVIAGKVTGIVGDKIDNYVDSQIDAIGSGYNECNDPDKKKKKGRKIGDPKWIYDPSGYVYEAVASNPLKDVTATVQYKNEQGVWTVWNAEEYDQVNPQLTDAAGKYGWDVPVGKWRVVWSKDGYETKISHEMDVPPPHTEVNYELVSRKSPEIESVTGVEAQGGSYIDITFTKYVKVVQGIPADAVVVTQGANAVLEGTLQFMKQEPSAADDKVKLSRTIRFTPKNALAAGGAYQVKLSRSFFVSYAHTMMQEQDAGPKPVMMKVLDTVAPQVTAVKVENGGRIIRLTLDEPIGLTADAAKFQITDSQNRVTSNAVTSAVAVMKKDVVDTNELLLTVMDPVMEGQKLKLLAGAVSDKEGNATAEGTQSLQPQENVNLSGLAVGTGALTPEFNSSETEYRVQLPAGTKELAVMATAANAAASLKIGTEQAVSGKAKIVSIPESGVIPVTVELGGGVTGKTYTIQVTYSTSPGGNPGPNPGPLPTEPPASQDPLNLGETAKMEKKPSANGGEGLVISISKDAVTEALKDNKKSKELYVEVKDQVEEVILEFPAAALLQLKAAEAALLVKTDMMNVRLEAASIDTGSLPEGATIRIVVAKAEKKHSDAAVHALKQQSGALKLLSDVVAVRAEAAHGSEVTPLAISSESPLEGQFLDKAGAANEVYRYDADSQAWQHVPSKPSADGRSLLFNVDGTGVYAVMSFTNPFRDTVGHWAQHDIEWMTRRLLVNGVSPVEFRPEGSVTRAEFAAMLVRALGLQLTGTQGAAAFTDVRQGEWYYEEVMAAASAGLVNGLDSGRFAPQETITREQMAVMIGRAFQAAGLGGSTGTDTGVLESFEDAGRIQSWAKADVALAVKEGLLQGLTKDSFGPSGITTRAQAAIVLERLLKKRD